ncbi:hypothetical protein [Pedobacter frigoris]|uniref:hypothetical protein n=1 Tax=Pedobacter frigoris TaxID=2571272 RepID=UPI002930793A|nr:hypothetical protein [Pedobacter frigoris]
MSTKTKIDKPLFARVAFCDKQTVLNIYGPMPVKKLKAIVEAIDRIVKPKDAEESRRLSDLIITSKNL